MDAHNEGKGGTLFSYLGISLYCSIKIRTIYDIYTTNFFNNDDYIKHILFSKV